ncbi:sensor domain-containing diguanylate cyclase [Legionella sp. 16cNR16C]|uniref:sensor domain-containing diguanylate cyclase n=1 Tax=Legionella sp. 16cNR16C TaxID=2905656 RepID=UPI001E29A22C|nr:sensor domain-containing diguanylate cyclase [Legionella sp. 16cNR16C]MCE3046424.1 diguanylate cyclase [Legionella sp. 16cNR16C]
MISENANRLLFREIFDAIPIGLILFGQDRRIHAWNQWMERKTNIDSEKAIGQTLESFYEDQISVRFNWALDQVLNYEHPQVLSNILNKFIIPIPLNEEAYLDLDMMQQNVEILPIHQEEEQMALVVIQDVSAKAHLNATLMSMASKFEKNSLIDLLTGCYNRRFLWKHLANELASAQREKYNVICCIYDIDHFKSINDRFGHHGGDEVLQSFANIVRSELRANDSFFRYGGEEFITLSTHVSIDDAALLPNRVRSRLADTLTHGSVKNVVTCSGGISYWQPDNPAISPEKLVKLADIQLYQAKESGRNCVVMNNAIQNERF